MELHLGDITLALTQGRNPQLRYLRCTADDFTMDFKEGKLYVSQRGSVWADGRQGPPNVSWLFNSPSLILTLPNLKEVSGTLSHGSGIIEGIRLDQLKLSVVTSSLRLKNVICSNANLHTDAGSIEAMEFTVENECIAEASCGRISLRGVLNEKAGYRAVSINGSIDIPGQRITGTNEAEKKGTPFFHLTANAGRIAIS